MTVGVRQTDAMTAPIPPRYRLTEFWTPSALVFGALSLIGLIGTLVFNVVSVLEGRNYLGDWFGSGPAVNSLGVDLFVVAVAGSILIVLEARRLGMRNAWLYIVLSAATAFAFTFPLFLAMRERRIRALASAAPAA